MKFKLILLTAIATFGLTAATIAQVPNYVPSNGLVGWWPFNGNANDGSGNGNNGTVNGATLTADRSGNGNSAYSFSSGNRIISSPSLPLGNSARSISIWFKTNSLNYNPTTGLGANSMVTYGTGPGTSGNGVSSQCNFETAQGNLVLNTYASGLGQPFVADNIWHNAIYTFNSAIHLLYLDGVLINTATYTLNTGNTQLMFGGRASEPNWHNYIGALDDIGIWNRALTPCEIQALYYAGTGLALH